MIHSPHKKIVLIVVAALLVVGIGVWWLRTSLPGRGSGAQNELATIDITNWQTARDDGAHATFRFPAELPTEYIHGQEWPPMVTISSEPFSCSESDDPTGGYEDQRKVNGQKYCVNTKDEGAAGSIYTTYTYAREKGDKLVSLRFVLRAVQCGNYDEPQKSACEAERSAFDVDNLVDNMIRSMVFD